MGNKCSKDNKHEKERKDADDLCSVRTQNENPDVENSNLEMENANVEVQNNDEMVLDEHVTDGVENEVEDIPQRVSPLPSAEMVIFPEPEHNMEEDQIFTGTTLVELPMVESAKSSSNISQSNADNENNEANEDHIESPINEKMMCDVNQNFLEKQTFLNMNNVDKAAALIAQKYGCSLGPSHDNNKCSICNTFDLSDAPLLA